MIDENGLGKDLFADDYQVPQRYGTGIMASNPGSAIRCHFTPQIVLWNAPVGALAAPVRA
jgi:hypothetical protein